MVVNRLNWISSERAAPELLKELDIRMASFYSSVDTRPDYQKLNDDCHDVDSHPNNKLAEQIALYIISKGFKDVLEVGCGSGRIYGHLMQHGFKGSYTGIEMADYVIQANRRKYPEASWESGSVYDLDKRTDSFDCCFCFYVLEHLIYPGKGLAAMMNRVRIGGSLVLLFPDFSCSGIVPSQKIGISYGLGAKDKLKRGKLLDGLISFWEAKIMRKRLKKVNVLYGDFVINYKPYCLEKDCQHILPDFDAIYLGNKVELERWAKERSYTFSYPLGTEGLMAKNAYISIVREK